MTLTRVLPLALLLAACGGVDPDDHVRATDASTVVDAGGSDASLGPYDGRACEPDYTACADAARTCDASTVELAIACERAQDDCRLTVLEQTRECFEAYACTAALAQLDCLPTCEAEYLTCLDSATTPHEISLCGGAAERCGPDRCGVSRWRDGTDGNHACR